MPVIADHRINRRAASSAFFLIEGTAMASPIPLSPSKKERHPAGEVTVHGFPRPQRFDKVISWPLSSAAPRPCGSRGPLLLSSTGSDQRITGFPQGLREVAHARV